MKKNIKEGIGQYLSAGDIMTSLGISRSGLFDLVKRGLFPKGVKLGRLRRWPLSEVLLFLDSQKEAVNE